MSVKKSVSEFADDFFKDRTEVPFSEFKEIVTSLEINGILVPH